MGGAPAETGHRQGSRGAAGRTAGRIAGLLDYQQERISLQDLINPNQIESLKNLITNIRVGRLQFGAVFSLQSGSH